jgi:pimeloyl-ACP methyl ester carboxylesterase
MSHAVTLVESENKPKIFIITGAGTPALNYCEIARGVANGAGVICFEQWGLFQSARPDISVIAAANRNIEYLNDIVGEGPLVLIGHSWGGLVAQEMAIRMAEYRRRVVLVLLDTHRPNVKIGDGHFLSVLLAAKDRTWSQRSRLLALRWYRIIRPRLSWLMRDDRFMRLLLCGVRSARNHRASVFSGPTLVIQAAKSRVGENWTDHPLLRIETSQGDHTSMCHAPHVHGLADIVNTFITSCLAEGSVARG